MLALQALTGLKPNNSMCWLRWHVGNGEDVVPSGLSGVVQVTPGESHTCAISEGSMLNTKWLLTFIHNGCRAFLPIGPAVCASASSFDCSNALSYLFAAVLVGTLDVFTRCYCPQQRTAMLQVDAANVTRTVQPAGLQLESAAQLGDNSTSSVVQAI